MHRSLLKYISFFLTFINFSCYNSNYTEPKISLDSYQIEKGFDLNVVTSEPFIEAPIAMSFDEKGRMWVVEMKAYMQNLEGTGEQTPNGRITILEDLDRDGVTDHSKIFMDSLVLPRAITHVYGGLLYCEPPNLWFVEIEDDKPIHKTLVDNKYVQWGNVEHQPNGLLMNIDNWIYNAKSRFRYQRKNGKWIKENTFFRGQWGITKDNFGRLYHNNNSIILKGDIVLPNTFSQNKHYTPKFTLGQKLTKNQNVFPLHATSVNRGYIAGNLNKDSILVNVTASCAPLIYRGNQFPEEYQQNAFTCAPEANVIKRNIIQVNASKLTAKQAIPKKEFIASTDEGFRPVNLYNGPDGNMYIVDMHRGILQDKAYLTPYLKNHYKRKKLDTIRGVGRILKVKKSNTSNNSDIIDITKLPTAKLILLLSNSNGWYRDKAQQLLVHRKDYRAVAPLKEIILNDEDSPVTKIHALHTLNGLEALNYNLLESIITSKADSQLKSHAIVLLESKAHHNYIDKMVKLSNFILTHKDAQNDLYLSGSLGKWISLAPKKFFPILLKLSNTYRDNQVYQEGVLSSIRKHETAFLTYSSDAKTPAPILNKFINKAINNRQLSEYKKAKKQKNLNQKSILAGKKIFNNICATCHGDQGQGTPNLAPPFIKSEFVSESSERLALILLHGLSGPIHVNKKLYTLSATMPGLGNNPEYTDKDIKNIISYLQVTFAPKEKPISISRIKRLRAVKPKQGVFSEKELLNY